MDWSEVNRTLTRAVMTAMAVMPRHEMDGNNLPSPLHIFFEMLEGENGPPFYDDHHLLNTDDDDNQVPGIDRN